MSTQTTGWPGWPYGVNQGGENPWLQSIGRWYKTLATAFPTTAPSPQWATENETVGLTATVAMRVYGRPLAAATPSSLPVLIVTPQVNHSYIADFSPEQSLVRTLRKAGVAQVAVTDWADPPRGRPYAIADSIDDIKAAVDRLGGRAHIIGLCQGGWQATMLTALQPDSIASLTVAAAPIDFHAGATLLHAFTLGMPMAFFETLVLTGGGVAPGALLSQGFDWLRPFERFFFNYASLYLHVDDDGYVGRYRELRNWYRLSKNVAGVLYLESVRELFKDNKLIKGTYRCRQQTVDLSSIRCPIYLVAGTRDHITPQEQVYALAAAAPQAPCERFLVDAGHIGVFMGRNALSTVWPQLAGKYLA